MTSSARALRPAHPARPGMSGAHRTTFENARGIGSPATLTTRYNPLQAPPRTASHPAQPSPFQHLTFCYAIAYSASHHAPRTLMEATPRSPAATGRGQDRPPAPAPFRVAPRALHPPPGPPSDHEGDAPPPRARGRARAGDRPADRGGPPRADDGGDLDGRDQRAQGHGDGRLPCLLVPVRP